MKKKSIKGSLNKSSTIKDYKSNEYDKALRLFETAAKLHADAAKLHKRDIDFKANKCTEVARVIQRIAAENMLIAIL